VTGLARVRSIEWWRQGWVLGVVGFLLGAFAVDGPLTVLALVMIPLIVLPLVMDLSPGTESAVLAIDFLIWAVFAAEYAIKLYLAPNWRQFVAHHIPDLIIVLVPMLRPRTGHILACAAMSIWTEPLTATPWIDRAASRLVAALEHT
jgi:hypothetical protein